MYTGLVRVNKERLQESEITISDVSSGKKANKLAEDIFNNKSDFILLSHYSIKDRKEAIAKLDDTGIIDVTIEDKPDLEFKYGDAKKKLFLIDISYQWTSEITMNSAIKALSNIEDVEDFYSKCVVNFTNEEMHKAIIDMYEGMQYHKLRSQINVFSRLQYFFKDFVDVLKNKEEKGWNYFKSKKIVRQLLGDVEEFVPEREHLIELARNMVNAQEYVIPLLIFEGVRLSKLDNLDEIRFLKKSDLKGNNLTIRGAKNGDVEERVIKLDDEVVRVVEEAIHTDSHVVVMKDNKTEIRPLTNESYIIRKTELSRTRVADTLDDNAMSFRGVYERVLNCKEIMEALTYDIPFTPTAIERYGKVYYVSRYVDEGMDVYDACREVLKRFGDYDINGGKSSPANSLRVNRLKNQWDVMKVKN